MASSNRNVYGTVCCLFVYTGSFKSLAFDVKRLILSSGNDCFMEETVLSLV
jgi:hypothetical protein